MNEVEPRDWPEWRAIRDRLQAKLELVEKMNADNAKMRAVYLDEKTRLQLQVGEQQKEIERLKEDLKYAECDANTQGIGIEQECDAKLEARNQRDEALRLNGEARRLLTTMRAAFCYENCPAAKIGRHDDLCEEAGKFLLDTTERPVHETILSQRDMKRLGDIIEEKPTEKRVDAVQRERCNVCGGHGVVGTRVNALTSRQDPCPKCVGGCVCTNPDDPAKTCLYHQKGD